jgi:uncharacterized iron-regulated membrane protein
MVIRIIIINVHSRGGRLLAMIRKGVFWLHLICGIVAGVVVLIMSVTGVILTYERQILAWEDEAYFAAPTAEQTRLPIGALVEGATSPQFAPETVVLSSDPHAPVVLRQGRSQSVYLNPYSGQAYSPHSPALDDFFSAVTGWHRWFNVSGEGRANARAITGAANLMFLFLIISGIYLWLPAVYRWSTMRLRLWFHPNARSGQARDFNWHHVFGFWAAIPLAVIVATATVFNYQWANAMVYRLAGEEPPQRGRAAPAEQNGNAGVMPAQGQPLSLDALFITAQEQVADWQTISLSLPAVDAVQVGFSIDEGNGGQPQKRHSLQLHAYTGDVVAWQPFTSQSAGRQARSWVRFLHTGEAFGFFGQTIAGLVSFAAVLMVWTGFALALRRFSRWLQRLRVRRVRESQYASVND